LEWKKESWRGKEERVREERDKALEDGEGKECVREKERERECLK
jgi:hypothetical protein